MQIEEAKDILANCIADYVIGDYCVGKYCPMEDECKDKDCPFQVAIDTVLNELEKKDKVIDEMAKYIKEPYQIITFGSRKPKIEIIKEYFYKKVEVEKNE